MTKMTLTMPAQPDLTNTVVGRWHRRLSSNPSAKRSHWRTKTIYFRSVAALVAETPGAQLTWKSIVDAAEPHGSRSTFYEVAGAHARHPLIEDFIDDGRMDSIQLALYYRRNDAVAQLLDEAKVWSYWAYRERLLAVLAMAHLSPEAMETEVTDSLLKWARSNPQLAAALNYAPPACVVEDLMVIWNGRLAAIRAANKLTDVLRAELRR